MIRRVLTRGLMAGAVVLGLEAAYALLRPSPDLPEHDPSADFGDSDNPVLRVAVLGDSSVTGPGVDSIDEIWISHVCDRLADGRRVEMRSYAVGGSTVRDLIKTQLEPAIAGGPQVVLVSVGGNDAIKGVPLRQFEADLNRLIGGLASTGATIIQSGVGDLGTIPRLYPPLRNIMSRRALKFDRAHRRVAEEHGAVVVDQRADDLRPWYRDRSLWASDLFHVSALGHQRWADLAWRAVGPAVNGTHGPD